MASRPGWFKRFRKRFPGEGKRPTIISPYKSYGTQSEIYLRGRVLEDDGIRPYSGNSTFRMLQNTIRRFNTFEKPDVDVVVQIASNTFETVTNEEGYFKLSEHITPIDIDEKITNWIPVHCHLRDYPDINSFTKMMIPSINADFGVISDIDDTVLDTGVSSFLKWRLVYNSALKHAQKRKPLFGAPWFYQVLHEGASYKNLNPFFYISNSPWNLYVYLNTFLEKHDFPNGPLLLRDFAFPGSREYRNEKNHKQAEIINIFNTYPDLKFILIGDSAEHDATIYSEVAKEFPDRVLCIYLHTINKKKQMQYVESVVNSSKHVEMLLVQNTKDAAIHAKERGFISENQYLQVVQKLNPKSLK